MVTAEARGATSRGQDAILYSGIVVDEPVRATTPRGVPVSRFRLDFTLGDQQISRRIIAFGETARTAFDLRPGQEVTILGSYFNEYRSGHGRKMQIHAYNICTPSSL